MDQMNQFKNYSDPLAFLEGGANAARETVLQSRTNLFTKMCWVSEDNYLTTLGNTELKVCDIVWIRHTSYASQIRQQTP